uniref:Deacetylase sirtuin-type domain-containing protein n=1 Tax=Leptobrachium leishanense TaxID=445787 RepID=A0A8C5QW18_9ANUR
MVWVSFFYFYPRTSGSGLYDNLQKFNIPPFFTLARELYPGKYKPNIVHYFVRLLHDKGLLMRCYKQYIDGLEMIAGIPQRKLVEAHGTFSSAGCHLLQFFSCKGSSGKILVCLSVIVKPDIDFPRADLLIVMGTSLKTQPFAKIINSVRPNVPRLLFNRDLVGPFKDKPLKSTDVATLGELRYLIRKLVHVCHWEDDMDKVLKPHTSKAGDEVVYIRKRWKKKQQNFQLKDLEAFNALI